MCLLGDQVNERDVPAHCHQRITQRQLLSGIQVRDLRYGILHVMLERRRRLAGPSPSRVVALDRTAWAVERVRRSLKLLRGHVQQRRRHMGGALVGHGLGPSGGLRPFYHNGNRHGAV